MQENESKDIVNDLAKSIRSAVGQGFKLGAEEEDLEKAVNILPKAADTDEEEVNMVDSPPHYTMGGVEVIDIIRDAVQDASPFEAVCLSNVLKYLLRYKYKDGLQDLNKANNYLDRLIEEVGKQREVSEE